MRILIIEDYGPIARAMQAALREQGHDVDWITGVRSFEPFVGIDAEKQDIAVTPTTYDLVMCDGELFGKNHGPAVVKQLVSLGVVCVGISSQHPMNNEMVALGAVAGLLKPCAFAAIADQTVNMEAWRQPSQQTLDAFAAMEQRIRDDRDLRKKLDSLLMAFMQV